MIDFACKKFNLDQIIKCSLNLTKSEFKVLEFFVINYDGWFSSHVLSKKLKMGLSTAQKALKKFKGKDVLQQKQKNISNGGYYLVYKLVNKSKLRTIILDIVHNWLRKVESELNGW